MASEKKQIPSKKTKTKTKNVASSTQSKKGALKKRTPAKGSAAKNVTKTKKAAAVKKSLPADTKKHAPAKKSALPSPPQKSSKNLSRKKSVNVIQKSKKSVLPPQKISDYDRHDNDALKRGDEPMTVVGHLDEFRSRLLIVLVTIIVLTIGGFFASEYLLKFIMQPFIETGQKLNIFKIAGGFIIRLKVSVIAAVIIGLPLLLFQLWRFIVPAISVKDRMFSRMSIIASIVLFYGGMAFVFFILLPFAIPMLLSFISTDMLSTIGADDYLSFIFIFCIAMGVLFELPIVIMILTKIGIVTPQFLIQKRKYAIVIIWILGALITPQDILSQILVAVPLMFLYEISIFISRAIFLRKHKKELMERAQQS